jgi:hypothetical protein
MFNGVVVDANDGVSSFADSFTFKLSGNAVGAAVTLSVAYADWPLPTDHSQVDGYFALPAMSFSLFNAANVQVGSTVNKTFSNVSTVPTTDVAATGLSFSGLAANGVYTLKVTGTGVAPNENWVAYNFNTNPASYDVRVASVAAVPEPESYAMLLAGLGLMGAVARRRAAK